MELGYAGLSKGQEDSGKMYMHVLCVYVAGQEEFAGIF